MVPMTTTATVDFVYPEDIQLSSPPLSGKFYVECADVDGGIYATQDMALDISAVDFKAVLNSDCSFIRDLFNVKKLTDTYSGVAWGVEF